MVQKYGLVFLFPFRAPTQVPAKGEMGVHWERLEPPVQHASLVGVSGRGQRPSTRVNVHNNRKAEDGRQA